jgi:hypothetical protein
MFGYVVTYEDSVKPTLRWVKGEGAAKRPACALLLLDRTGAADIIIRDHRPSLRRCRLVDLPQCLTTRHLRRL